VANPLPGVAVRPVGADGIVEEIIWYAADFADSVAVTELYVVIAKLYVVPLTNVNGPATELIVQDTPGLDAVFAPE
jgi:hypothetical protein